MFTILELNWRITMSITTSKTNNIKYDIWRDSLLRYAGYANEIGEAFAPIFPKFLKPSYGISLLYVIGKYINILIYIYIYPCGWYMLILYKWYCINDILGDTYDKSYSAYNDQKQQNPTKVTCLFTIYNICI